MITEPRQTLIDIACGWCGSPEKAVDIAILTGLPLSEPPEPGQALTLPSEKVSQVAAFFSYTPYPATAIDEATKTLGGIGYMSISGNFIVS